jgi:hypothetical protein
MKRAIWMHSSEKGVTEMTRTKSVLSSEKGRTLEMTITKMSEADRPVKTIDVTTQQSEGNGGELDNEHANFSHFLPNLHQNYFLMVV